MGKAINWERFLKDKNLTPTTYEKNITPFIQEKIKREYQTYLIEYYEQDRSLIPFEQFVMQNERLTMREFDELNVLNQLGIREEYDHYLDMWERGED